MRPDRHALLLCLPLLMLFACGGDTSTKPKGKPVTEEMLLGSWQGTNPGMGGKSQATFVFNTGGVLQVSTTAVGGVAIGLPPAKGTWQLEDGQIKLTGASVWNKDWMPIELQGSVLVMDGKYRFRRAQ